jgi:putative phosphoesterase
MDCKRARSALFSSKKNILIGERMLVGLLGDTHDNLFMVEKAVKRLNRETVELVLHTGDYVSPFVVPKFKELKARLIGGFGNNDGNHELLKKRFSENERLEMRGSFARIAIDDLEIALLHGDDEELLKALIEKSTFDVVVHGHSHRAEACRKGKVLVINPGEVCGYLSGKSTIAVLDTSKRDVKVIGL